MLMLPHRQKDRGRKVGEGLMRCERALRRQVFRVFIFLRLQTTLVLGTSKEMKKLIQMSILNSIKLLINLIIAVSVGIKRKR